MKKYILFILLSFPFALLGQRSDLGNWLIYIGNKKIATKWNWHHEVQYRNYNVIGDLEQLLLRTGIGYNLGKDNNNILLGYAFIHSQNYLPNRVDKVMVNEHRIFQQFTTKQKLGRVYLSHRYRFEQRFIQNQPFRLRFRYFLSANVPLNHKTMVDKTVYLSAYNEIFINTHQSFFDRNRLYGGVGFKLNKLIKFELGYMNQFLDTENRDQINLFILLSF